MVTDSIQNAPMYEGLGEGIASALRYFANYDASKHENEPEAISPDITVRRFCYTTAPSEGIKLEAHQRYIDVMFIAEGEEGFYHKPFALCEDPTPYDPAGDYSLAGLGEGAAFVPFRTGYFAIFYPQDGHCAGRLLGAPSGVIRLVAKVPVAD